MKKKPSFAGSARSLIAASRMAAGAGAAGGTGQAEQQGDEENQLDQLPVYAFSWNVGGLDAAGLSDKLLEEAFAGAAGHDLLVIGLQEVTDMGGGVWGVPVSSLHAETTAKGEAWTARLSEFLGKNSLTFGGGSDDRDFICVGTQECAPSSMLLVFVARTLAASPAVLLSGGLALKTAKLGCGPGGVGTKGGAGASLSVRNVTLGFVSAHLPAHQNKVKARNHAYDAIRSGLLLGLETADVEIWLGDLNYRIDLPYDEVVNELIPNKRWAALREEEQLSAQIKSGSAFKGFSEGELDFAPTYKFNDIVFAAGQSEGGVADVYDTSKKKRVPAWTDRVLFRDPDYHAQLKSYTSVPSVRVSDHRPVAASFVLRTECS